jgi:hypothetical protein
MSAGSGFLCAVLLVASAFLAGKCLAAEAPQGGEGLFPFVLPWDDSSPAPANVSDWDPKPAGSFGRVTAGSDGHLYAGGRRVRFFGVDLAFDAAVPEKADAEKVAARMAKFGINIVRFHIIDMASYPRGILAKGDQSTRRLDPEGLDRLDYFTAQLKKNGIYTNMNTLCYRYINSHDGLPAEIDKVQRAEDRNVIGFFYAPALDLQKEYARELLGHRNAYTGLTYAEDPAVAFVEIHNENGLIHAYLGGRVDSLPAVFLADLARQWNAYLKQKYGSTDALRAAWDKAAEPLGAELLKNGDFSHGLDEWRLELNHGAEGTMKLEEDAPAELAGSRSVRISVSKPDGMGWPVRFEEFGLKTQQGRHMTVTFWAKAPKPCTISVGIEQAHEPWHQLAVPVPADLTEEWTRYSIVFGANATDEGARLIFDNRFTSGAFSLAGISLREGGTVGLLPGERLEDGTVPLLPRTAIGARTSQVAEDGMQFLWETEDRYWTTMRDYFKKDLKVEGLVIGTATGCSTPNMMAGMDCEDAHAYWMHPQFPNRPWDARDWFVQNVPMTNSPGGNLPDLALRRVLDKPQAITEYGHPAPNEFGGEADILYAAYGALQDWDYLSLSRYSQSSHWSAARVENWFEIDKDPVRMAGIIAAEAIFRRGDVQAARQVMVAPLSRERETALLQNSHPWELVTAGTLGVPREAALVHRVAIATEGQAVPAGALPPGPLSPDAGRYVSDTGELVWDLSKPDRGVVTVNAPKSKAVVGYGAGKRFELGGVVIEPGQTAENGFSTISLTVLRGDLPGACDLLVTATGKVQNSNWGWEQLTGDRVTLRDKWGTAPTLIESVPASITLPLPAGKVSAWALDERGQRAEPLSVEADKDGHAVLRIGPPHKTLWYEVVSQ